MITIHHLTRSRSERIVWLMEELGLEYRLEVQRPGAGWTWLGPTRETSSRGYVSVRARLPRGTQVRLWSPADDVYGVPVLVT